MIIKSATIGASVLALALVGACKPPVDTAKDEAAIRALETQWVADLRARDLAKDLTYYDAQATEMSPFGAPAKGPDAIRTALGPLFSDPNFSLVFDADEVGVSSAGDMAYTRGHFTFSQSDPATHAKVTQTGNYVTVYKKQPDGGWKALEDIASPGVQAPAAPPAAK